MKRRVGFTCAMSVMKGHLAGSKIKDQLPRVDFKMADSKLRDPGTYPPPISAHCPSQLAVSKTAPGYIQNG